MKIIELKSKVPVKFSWLKYVSKANLSEHCAHSLVGEYETRWKRYGDPVACKHELQDARYYYLCCVTQDYKTNIHVAWRRKDGSILSIDNDLVKIVVTDAEQVPITPRHIYKNLTQAQDWHFCTCRNWWFANMIAREDETKDV